MIYRNEEESEQLGRNMNHYANKNRKLFFKKVYKEKDRKVGNYSRIKKNRAKTLTVEVDNVGEIQKEYFNGIYNV